MNVLVTGANGQLGQEIKAISDKFSSFKLYYTSSKELNITDAASVYSYIRSNQITAVVNCAAYTAVDKAETDNAAAFEVNERGVQNIVEALEKVNGKLIHISTDYVFDGTNHTPYTEMAPIAPLGVYGASKRKGEEVVLNSTVDAIVIRTSWLYSSFGTNFVKTMLRLGREREELSVICDQIGTPTYARDLAIACLTILEKQKSISANGNVYHYSNEGVASWYDFAAAIMELTNTSCKIEPIETKDYPTLAQRPCYSVLNKSKIKKDFHIVIPHWRVALQQCLKSMDL